MFSSTYSFINHTSLLEPQLRGYVSIIVIWDSLCRTDLQHTVPVGNTLLKWDYYHICNNIHSTFVWISLTYWFLQITLVGMRLSHCFYFSQKTVLSYWKVWTRQLHLMRKGPWCLEVTQKSVQRLSGKCYESCVLPFNKLKAVNTSTFYPSLATRR